jgi:hypothetical protein
VVTMLKPNVVMTYNAAKGQLIASNRHLQNYH